jgi:hypothetical protein
MKKEKDYTLTIDIHVSKEDGPKQQRRYFYKIYGHPIHENEPVLYEVSNFREEKALELGNKVLEAIWELAGKKDADFWSD